MAAHIGIPTPLQNEHDELHLTLLRATKEDGAIGAAAKNVARLLHPHFLKEEQFALPPIGLLQHLARGELTPDMKDALALTDRLEAELPGMLNDHREIAGALKGLLAAARSEDKVEYAEFAEHLIRHAQTEELVTYPAALLVGRYLRLKLGEGGR